VPITRIFSDLHYGDRASALKTLRTLEPLFAGADRIVLNGDTLDTRPSPDPAATAALRAEVVGYFGGIGRPVQFIPGNHDPDISDRHSVELAEGRVFVTHGDILFEDVVPWSQDAAMARQRVQAELAQLPPDQRGDLTAQLAAVHRASATLPQRHQSEKHGLKYALGFLSDTVWPPTRVLRVLRAWRESAPRAARLIAEHKLRARFFVMGHTHRFGAKRGPGGLVVLNTGSFCAPGQVGVVDVTAERIALRRIEKRGGSLRFGATIAEFPLAAN